MEFPIRLENSFFPVQEVRAIPEHNIEETRAGSEILITHHVEELSDRNNAFGVFVTLRLDEEKSKNPPYFFELSAYGIFTIDEESEIPTEASRGMLEFSAIQILIGAIRERLASLTSRAPWGTFTLGIVPIAITPKNEEPE